MNLSQYSSYAYECSECSYVTLNPNLFDLHAELHEDN